MEKELLPCDVAVSLQIFGTKIKILVVKELLKGTKRFSELNRAIPCTQKVLTSNLRELEKDKIISRKVYAVVPPKCGIFFDGNRQNNRAYNKLDE